MKKIILFQFTSLLFIIPFMLLIISLIMKFGVINDFTTHSIQEIPLWAFFVLLFLSIILYLINWLIRLKFLAKSSFKNKQSYLLLVPFVFDSLFILKEQKSTEIIAKTYIYGFLNLILFVFLYTVFDVVFAFFFPNPKSFTLNMRYWILYSSILFIRIFLAITYTIFIVKIKDGLDKLTNEKNWKINEIYKKYVNKNIKEAKSEK